MPEISYFNIGFLRQGNAALDRAYLGISGGAGGLVATGGIAGDVYTKNSATDFDASWQPGGSGSPNLDGGIPSSTYGAISPINGGTP